ncbi:MAG: hypothetical protein QXM96_00730 [Candidatus Woesearchaeota archaeon]
MNLTLQQKLETSLIFKIKFEDFIKLKRKSEFLLIYFIDDLNNNLETIYDFFKIGNFIYLSEPILQKKHSNNDKMKYLYDFTEIPDGNFFIEKNPDKKYLRFFLKIKSVDLIFIDYIYDTIFENLYLNEKKNSKYAFKIYVENFMLNE